MSKSKKGKLKSYAKVEGIGNDCPKCKVPMERRKREKIPKGKTYFYKKWDYCSKCSHVQHYEEFKSEEWKEVEQVNKHFNSI